MSVQKASDKTLFCSAERPRRRPPRWSVFSVRGVRWLLLVWMLLVFLASFSLPIQFARAQNEVAWQISSTALRPIDPIEAPHISEGFAIIGVGSGVGVYDLETGAPIRDITLPVPNPIERRTFAAAGGKLLISDTIWDPNDIRGQSRAYVFDISTGEQLSQLELPTPELRVGLGASVAMDDRTGLLTSLSCLDTCYDEERFEVWGVVDAFDLKSGAHLFQIVGPNDSVFGQGLAIGDGVIAVSARSNSLEEAGRVQLYDAANGSLRSTVVPDVASAKLSHNFGFTLDIDGNQLVVGDNPDLRGHGMLGDGKGLVTVYDLTTSRQIANFSTDDVGLEGTPGFGTSVAIANGRVIAGAPNKGLELKTERLEAYDELDTGACAESFTTGGPCFDPPDIVEKRGAAVGQAQLIDVATGGPFSRLAWIGGDHVAISDDFALVTSSHGNRTSVYAISLEGLPRAGIAATDVSLRALGDINNDGDIAFADFLVLSTNYGKRLSRYADGDLDQDGMVGFSDFLIFSDNFRVETAITSVPEPDFNCFRFGIALALVLYRRSRDTRRMS